MANPDAPIGFRPIGRNGGPYNGPLHRVFIPSTATTTDVFVGDIVVSNGSGSTDGYPTVIAATSVTAIPYGVVVGLEANPSNLEQQYYPKGTAGRYAKVVFCDEAVFECQTSSVMELADIGLNGTPVYGAGSTVTGIAGGEFDGATASTTVTDMLQIQSFVDRADNDPTLTNANLIVKFNVTYTNPDRLGVV